MKCNKELVEDYVEQFLDEDVTLVVYNHIQTCKNCQRFYKQLLEEQQLLQTALHTTPVLQSQQMQIMTRLHKKQRLNWQKMKIIGTVAAAFVLSFTIWQITKPTQQPLVESTPVEMPISQAAQPKKDPLDFSLVDVTSTADNTTISFSTRFIHSLYDEQFSRYESLLTTYKQIHVANIPTSNSDEDDFFGYVRPIIQFAIRKDDGTLITSTIPSEHKNEVPIQNFYSSSTFATDTFSEVIYTTSVPKETNAATIEILQARATTLNDETYTVASRDPKPVQIAHTEYTFESFTIKNGSLHVTAVADGSPTNRVEQFMLVRGDELIGNNSMSINEIDGRTVYSIVFENTSQLADTYTFMPLIISQQIDIEPTILHVQSH